jgi:hypothetical protein
MVNADLLSRGRLLVALLAALLALGLAGQLFAAARADAAGLPADLRVAHTVKEISVPGSRRPMVTLPSSRSSLVKQSNCGLQHLNS